jgi:hypothetical protein
MTSRSPCHRCSWTTSSRTEAERPTFATMTLKQRGITCRVGRRPAAAIGLSSALDSRQKEQRRSAAHPDRGLPLSDKAVTALAAHKEDACETLPRLPRLGPRRRGGSSRMRSTAATSLTSASGLPRLRHRFRVVHGRSVPGAIHRTARARALDGIGRRPVGTHQHDVAGLVAQ